MNQWEYFPVWDRCDINLNFESRRLHQLNYIKHSQILLEVLVSWTTWFIQFFSLGCMVYIPLRSNTLYIYKFNYNSKYFRWIIITLSYKIHIFRSHSYGLYSKSCIYWAMQNVSPLILKHSMVNHVILIGWSHTLNCNLDGVSIPSCLIQIHAVIWRANEFYLLIITQIEEI